MAYATTELPIRRAGEKMGFYNTGNGGITFKNSISIASLLYNHSRIVVIASLKRADNTIEVADQKDLAENGRLRFFIRF